MSDYSDDFNRGSIRPFQCLSEGWALISGHYWLYFGIVFVGLMIGFAVPLWILLGPMMCGIYLCLLGKLDHRREPKFDLLFRGFDHFGQSLIATLCMVVPMMVILLPAYIVYFINLMKIVGPGPGGPGGRGGPPPDLGRLFTIMGLFYLVVIVVSIVAHTLYFFIYPLIIDRRLSGWDAVRLSFRAALANLGGILGVIVLNFGLNLVGMMLCCFGVVFVLPLTFAMIAVAYRQVFPRKGYDDDFDREPSPRRVRDDANREGIQPPPLPERY